MVGLIIGRGGEQITRLQAETGCKIQMASDSGSPGLVFSKTLKKKWESFSNLLSACPGNEFFLFRRNSSF